MSNPEKTLPNIKKNEVSKSIHKDNPKAKPKPSLLSMSVPLTMVLSLAIIGGALGYYFISGRLSNLYHQLRSKSAQLSQAEVQLKELKEKNEILNNELKVLAKSLPKSEQDLVSLCKSGNGDGCFELYIHDMKLNNFDRAIPTLHDNCNIGKHALSCILVADFVRSDEKRYIHYLDQACHLGHEYGCRQASRFEKEHGNMENAITYAVIGCDKLNSARNCGIAGLGFHQLKHDKSVTYLRKACLMGNNDLCIFLGDFLWPTYRGKEAAEYYKRACDNGVEKGCQKHRDPAGTFIDDLNKHQKNNI